MEVRVLNSLKITIKNTYFRSPIHYYRKTMPDLNQTPVYTIDWLCEKYDRGEKLRFIFFWGHTGKPWETVGKFVFSQWFVSPFVVDGKTYPTAEHWMMSQKALLFNAPDISEKILQTVKPGEVKELGRQINHFDAATWDAQKLDLVTQGNIHKFGQHKNLGDFLLGTGDQILVEASPTDFIWGIGLSKDAANIENPHTWRGTNLLGFALMSTRDFLKKQADKTN